MRKFIICFASLMFLASLLPAVDPPERINYQGVLRDSSDKPINTSVDMKFRFYDASVAGTLLWEEVYDAITYPPAITVSNGLFTLALGDPAHRNAGSILNFPDIFKNYSNVYLAVVAGADPEMTPRIKVISSAYALNTKLLSGKSAGEFLDTSSTAQTKTGKAVFNASAGNYGVEGYGPTAGGYFKDSTQSGIAYIGFGDEGIEAYGNLMGGYFSDLNNSGFTYVGYGDNGISAFGNYVGGYFVDSNSSGFAYVGYGDFGIEAFGNACGGNFRNLSSSGNACVGYGDYGISAYGNYVGGYFEDSNSSGNAYVGYGDYGISAYGNTTGGYFKDANSSGYAYVGYLDNGISAYGNTAGGYFKDANSSGYAYVGWGDYGIAGYGNIIGGYFRDLDSSGLAYVGYGDRGISAYGNTTGGYFEDLDSSGYAYVGNGDYGIYAGGNNSGGYFYDSNNSGLAYVGYGDRGIWGKGTFAGGTFSHPDNVTYWADVSTSTRKIIGTGTVSFVQNHPYDKSKVITYAAPEGDEVAVYTRGTARLFNGEALVKLGESFSWVANPDIGLTAHLTPREPDTDIYVESLSTDELLVRANNGSNPDATFDYIVFGLRIGFEELAVVQAKDEREAFLPASEAIQEPYAQNPELKAYNALERFKRMRQSMGGAREIDLARSQSLAAAIDENKQEILAKAREQMELERKQRTERPDEPAEVNPEGLPEAFEGIQQPSSVLPELIDRSSRTVSGAIPVDEEGNVHAKSFRSSFTDLTRNLPVSEPVDTGDVLVVDPLNPQAMKPADTASDPNVIGIVAGEPGVILGQEQSEVQSDRNSVAVALSGIVLCRADARYEAIRIGDLLTTSATKGHAMKSPDNAPGTIIGKALEPLDAGTGLIKVLVMLR